MYMYFEVPEICMENIRKEIQRPLVWHWRSAGGLMVSVVVS